MFNILGKFFFFYMISGSAWALYNKHMYGKSNVDDHSTGICVYLSIALVIVVELYELFNKKKGEEK